MRVIVRIRVSWSHIVRNYRGCGVYGHAEADDRNRKRHVDSICDSKGNDGCDLMYLQVNPCFCCNEFALEGISARVIWASGDVQGIRMRSVAG